MDEDIQKNKMTYLDILRGSVAKSDYITSIVLINEVKNRTLKKKETPDTVYSILLEVADELNIKNPFSDKDSFFFIFQKSIKLQSIDWELVITKETNDLRIPIVSSAIVNLYKERFAKKPSSVLIAEAEKFVPNLKRIVDENINSKFTLTTQNKIYAKALEYVFVGYDNVEILLTDIYKYDFVNKHFDLILSCPNFGYRMLVDDKRFICREFEMVALENLSMHLNSYGHLVIILPARITFAYGKVNDLRQFIQTTYTIRELSELPEGSLCCIGIKVYLIDIENTRTEKEDIIIRRYSGGERKNRKSTFTSLEVKDDTFVKLDKLTEQGNWSIDHIFAQQDEEYLKFQKSDIRKVYIENVAQIFRGKAVNKKDISGNIGVVNISNIGDYEIDYESLDRLDEKEERKIASYLLQEGDVLLTARGTTIKTAVFHKQSYPCIASSNVIVIRPDQKSLDGYYLKIFLDSPIGKKMINGVQQGMIMINISYKDLNSLEIPLPSIEKQEEIVKEYKDELKKYIDTITVAEQRWSEALKKLQTF